MVLLCSIWFDWFRLLVVSGRRVQAVVLDASPCTQHVRVDVPVIEGAVVVDSSEFLADTVLPRLGGVQKLEYVVVGASCGWCLSDRMQISCLELLAQLSAPGRWHVVYGAASARALAFVCVCVCRSRDCIFSMCPVHCFPAARLLFFTFRAAQSE